MRLTIKSKLSAAFGAVLVLPAAAGGISYVRMSDPAENQAVLSKQGWRQGKIGDLENALWTRVPDATANSAKENADLAGLAVAPFSGATILGDGSAALILDVAQLVAQGQARTDAEPAEVSSTTRAA